MPIAANPDSASTVDSSFSANMPPRPATLNHTHGHGHGHDHDHDHDHARAHVKPPPTVSHATTAGASQSHTQIPHGAACQRVAQAFMYNALLAVQRVARHDRSGGGFCFLHRGAV